jgi:SAM-dependent methyltransferase
MSDERASKYQDLHSKQLSREEASNRYSAETILDILSDYLKPSSVVDIGCGLGTWLKVLADRGLTDLRGADGPWFDPKNSLFDPGQVTVCDFEKDIDLGRRFDLAICLEVAEHISGESAERFVASLARHAPVVMFSAAIPYQGGTHHLNEQFLPYWAKKFAAHGYRPVDVVRPRIWNDGKVLVWLRQNLVLFAHDDAIAGNPRLAEAAKSDAPLSIVHPDMFTFYARQVNQLLPLQNLLIKGGTFRTWVNDDQVLKVRRVPD